ncbi:MAG TPA: hypothetical protein VJ912_02630 [Candidatus Nanoarchaeia archaeon]|nr:hypothetical protein [Candidatus Nanoarchaeia archaeon]
MREKTKIIIPILLFCISISIFFLLFLNNQSEIIEKKSTPISLNISDKAGFDLNKSALTFGNLIPGTSSEREIIIKNNYEFPLNVEIQVQGDIKKYLEYKKIVKIEPNKKKKINFIARIPKKEEQRKYSGKVIVIMKK